ncbi:ABC transporter permease [Azospirillum sp. SYSU D00513]|uniref:ABC transporter permease n=1 Tax=Azospirillum sp. SYSU D00513 TaxID=2812561 RepID=UPI001A95EE54|nr:ABC transporter permease [Azospirillum sp. SYSU D00513]
MTARPILKTLGHRLFQALLVGLAVGTLTFLLARLLPGDMAFRVAAGRYGYDNVTGSAADAVRLELGLDQPALMALGAWLWDLAQFDLGRSLISGEPVIAAIRHQLGHSADLAGSAILLSLLIGPPLGILAGLRPGGVLDRALLPFAAGLRALPQFVLGVLLIVLFAVGLGLLPAAGYGTMEHRLLPAITLALGLAAVSSRVARDATLAVTASPYYAFARTKGLPEGSAFLRHGLRNIGVPVTAYLGVQLVYLIEGVVVVESLFAWPGIGHALVHAIFARDVPMIQGTALVMALGFVLLNALVDLACFGIDPRRRKA